MKRLLIVPALGAVALSLGGCNTVFGGSQNFQAFLNDIQTCDREYQVAFGGGVPSVNGSAHVTCKGKTAAPAPVTVPAA